MKPSSDKENFYETERQKRRTAPPPGLGPQVPWEDLQRRRQRTTLFYTLLVFVCAVAILLVAIQQHLFSVHPATERPVGLSGPAITSHSSLAFGPAASERDLWLLDELQPTNSLPAADASAGFHLAGLKQAAYVLLQAERAERENKPAEALKQYRTLLSQFPQLQGVRQAMGRIHLQRREYAEAVALLQAAQQQEPPQAGVVNELGAAWMAQTNYAQAEACFQRAISLAPMLPAAHFNLAVVQQRRGQLRPAVESFRNYLTLAPADTAAAQTYAKLLLDLQEWREAANVLGQLATVTPDAAPVYFRLAQALAHTADPEGAVKALERGCSLVDAKLALGWLSHTEFDLLRPDPRFRQLLETLSTSGK